MTRTIGSWQIVAMLVCGLLLVSNVHASPCNIVWCGGSSNSYGFPLKAERSITTYLSKAKVVFTENNPSYDQDRLKDLVTRAFDNALTKAEYSHPGTNVPSTINALNLKLGDAEQDTKKLLIEEGFPVKRVEFWTVDYQH